MLICPSGHRAYSGYVAEAAQSRPRLQWLDDRILAGDPAPDAETARRGGIWPGATAAAPHGASAPPEASPVEDPGLQNVLLALGAGLLLIAGIVFTAVVWDRLGVGGHVTVMALATVGFGTAAVRLAHRLPATAEALAVVAFGLAVIDIIAAPALGLVPESWLAFDVIYPTAVTAVLAMAALLLGKRFGLAAWVWFGWVTVAVTSALLTWFLALGPAGSNQPWAAISVTVVAITTVALAAAPFVSARLHLDQGELLSAAVVGFCLTVIAWLGYLVDLDTPAIVGTAITTMITATATDWVWRRTAQPLAGVTTASLVGVAGGLVLLIPRSQSVWMSLAVALAGAALLVGLTKAGHLRVGLLASASLWATWLVGRIAISVDQSSDFAVEDAVILQLSVLLALVALSLFVVAGLGLEPWLAWAAALIAEIGWLISSPNRPELPDLVESWSLPFAVLLLVAGVIWHHGSTSTKEPSLSWLGPGVSMAVIPSALWCWGAPWVDGASEQSNTEALVRLALVLLVGVALVVAGVRLRLTGLFAPGAIALAIAGAAQAFGTLSALPRWLGIGLAGATVFILGARIEWLRGRGRRVRSFVGALH